MENKVITTHVPQELSEAVDRIAARLDRSKNWIVRQALADFVALEDERYNLTREGLDAIDSAQVVDHADMRAWADSLPEADGAR